MAIIHSDFHVHTFPSSRCAQEEATIENYMKLALEQGITDIGISNHFWDDDKRHQNEDQWFFDHSWDNLYKVCPDIPKDTKGIRFYLGCEVDVDKDNVIGLAPQNAERLDYVLIATNHFHASGFEVEAGTDLNDVKLIKKLQIEHYLTAVRADFNTFTIIAHPFLIHGVPMSKEAEFMKAMSDDEFKFLFEEAKKHNVAIEIHIAHVSSHKEMEQDEAGFDKDFVRMFKIANEVGCKFTFGSDAHWMSMFTHGPRYDEFVKHVGIKEENIVQSFPTSHLMEIK